MAKAGVVAAVAVVAVLIGVSLVVGGVVGGRGVDPNTVTCADLHGDDEAMHEMAHYIQGKANSADLTALRTSAVIAYTCFGIANQQYRPTASALATAHHEPCEVGFPLLGRRTLACDRGPPGEFVRCYISPTLSGCGSSGYWPLWCKDFLNALPGSPKAGTNGVDDCRLLRASSHHGAAARRAFPY